MAAPAGEDKDVDAFLADCTPSGDAAYGAAKAVLERLHAATPRPAARRLLGAVRRRFAASRAAGEECFRTFHFRIHDVVLDPHVQGPAASTTSTASTSLIRRAMPRHSHRFVVVFVSFGCIWTALRDLLFIKSNLAPT
jgi:hypothetical protein